MIFNKSIVIGCETMNRSKIFTSFRNIKDVIQKKISIWGVNKTFAYLADSHTCSAGRVYLIRAVIFVPHGELVKFRRDVVRGTGVSVPVCINAIGSSGSSRRRALLRRPSERGIEPFKASEDGMAFSATELVDVVGVLSRATATAPVVAAVAATACTTTATAAAASTKRATTTTCGGVSR